MLTQQSPPATNFCDAGANSPLHSDIVVLEIPSNAAMAVSKGQQVRIKRPESYWFNEVGTVASVADAGKYPVNVRFEKVDYKAYSGIDGGINTANYAEAELESA